MLRTFGRLELEGSTFQCQKPLLLLTYLTLEGPKPRRYLAELFYTGTEDPHNGLSRGLSFLKAALPDAFETQGVKLHARVACDAKLLLDLLDKEQLEQGVALYQGSFLEGVGLAMGEELEEWVFETREFLASRVREALLREGERHLAQGRAADAALSADAAYLVPGVPELEPEDFQRMYELLHAGSNPRAVTVRKAAASYGLTLSPPSRKVVSPGNGLLGRTSLPPVSTSLVGREAAVADLSAWLTGEECRLVSVLGPGGVGKSRLALEVGHELLAKGSFRGGVHFVSLETLTDPQLVLDKLAEVLMLNLRSGTDLASSVRGHIGALPVLLIFDACEHVAEGLRVLTEVLDACPNLKVLTTSRERLHLDAEWTYVLDGLATPEYEEELFGAAAQTAAIQLFVQRAKRSRLQFALTPEELPHVLRICQLVGGFPLGIELAAAWVRILSPLEIVREIEADLTFLDPKSANGIKSQSVRAVFESSWRRLNLQEQQVLCQLSVFYGGFRKEAAAAVADATTPLLASLVDKSLLRLSGNGRYDRHALLHQFMVEKLAERQEDEVGAAERHGRYFHTFLAKAESELRGARAREAVVSVREELENLRLAWAWALRSGAGEEIARSAPALRVFFDKEGRFSEGVAFFANAVTTLHGATGVQRRALGVVLVEQAWFVFRLGRRETAASLAERGLDILRPLQATGGLREGLHVLGALRLDAGSYEGARKLWQEAHELAALHNDDAGTAHSLELLGLVEELAGNTGLAERHYRRALELGLRLGDNERTVDTLNNLATLLIDTSNFPEAESLLRRGLKLAHEVGASRLTPYLTDNLAKVAHERGDHPRALSLGLQALSLARESGELPIQARVLETLGRSSMAAGDFAAAAGYFKQGLAETVRMNAVPFMLQLLVRVAQLHIARNQDNKAAFLLGVVADRPALPEAGRKLAEALLSDLKARLASEALAEGLAAGKTAKIDEIVEQAVNLPSE